MNATSRLAGALALLLAASWGPAAHAAPCDDPRTPEDFKRLVDDAETAISLEDIPAHTAIWGEIKDAVRCMTAPVDNEDWARFLFGLALVRYAAEQDWEGALRTALFVDPKLARPYGPEAVRTWQPADSPPTRPPPQRLGWTFWADGRPVAGPLVMEGPHLLQWSQGDAWEGRVIEGDTALPTPWRDAMIDPAPPAPPAPPAAPTPAAFPPPTPVFSDDWTLRFHGEIGFGWAMGAGGSTADGVTEPTQKLLPTAAIGLEANVGPGWVRAAAGIQAATLGPFVYQRGDAIVSSRIGPVAHVAGGGRVGIGHFGALVGIALPSRVQFDLLGGVTVSQRTGVRLELRGGLFLRTDTVVEPHVAFAVTFVPRLVGGRFSLSVQDD